MQHSEQIHEIAAAMAKAQSAIEGAVRNNMNPAFRSKYADLGAVWDAIREPLSAAGIAVWQGLQRTESGVACDTLLAHSSGQWVRSTFEVPVGKQDAQGYGSAASYVRRYALMALVGIAPIDDDGNAAVGNAPPPKVEQKDPLTHDPKIVATIRGAKTLEDLQTAWKSIPANVRARYAEEKDAAKARISTEVA